MRGVIHKLTRMMCFILAAVFAIACSRGDDASFSETSRPTAYYLDAIAGNDKSDGRSANMAWRSLSKLDGVHLRAGDTVKFKRGTAFVGPLFIRQSGTNGHPIVITAYGQHEQPPAFTNPVFEQDNFGNCIRIKGSHVIVENLYFHNTSAHVPGNYQTDGGWDVWEMGAIYIDKGAQYCIVRNNEIEDCVVGVKSYGRHALIENNYIHDCNRVLKEWGWGPIGIWLGADDQEARFNTIVNYRAEHPNIQWVNGVGGGADGGAFEIDDARFDKSNIHIHHNYSRDCQGFLEVTWTDVKQHPDYRDFRIHHNISDDYQQFVAIWQGEACLIEHNTIVRRKTNANDWGVFNITENNARNKIRNNVIITENDIPVFNTGLRGTHTPNNIISHNLYFAASGSLVMGKEGPGTSPIYGHPLLQNYAGAAVADDYRIQAGSPAIDRGLALGYQEDFLKHPIPERGGADVGAFEYAD